MMSAEELLALYAANFGGDTRATPNLPGAVQPNTNTIQYDPYVISEDNMPGGWNSGFWSSSSSPSGHIYQHLMQGYSVESKDSQTTFVAAVL